MADRMRAKLVRYQPADRDCPRLGYERRTGHRLISVRPWRMVWALRLWQPKRDYEATLRGER